MKRTGMEAVRSIIYIRSNKVTNMFEQAPRSVLELWGDFLIGEVYVLNRVISSKPIVFFGTKPDLSNLRVFGCRGYPHTPLILLEKVWTQNRNHAGLSVMAMVKKDGSYGIRQHGSTPQVLVSVSTKRSLSLFQSPKETK